MVHMNFTSTCPLYPSLPDRCDTVIAVKRGFASLSLICCFVLICLILIFRKHEVFLQRMVLMLTISALFDSITYIAGDIYEEGPGCNAQAFFMSYFDWSTLLWVCCITFNLWMIAIKQVKKSGYEIWYNVVCWTFPLVMSVIPFIGGHYGPSGVWCWIGDQSPGWRLGLWYIPLYTLVLVMLVTNIYIVVKVFVKAREWDGGFDSGDETDKKQLKEEVKTLVAYPFVYLLLNLPPLIYRIYGALHPEQEASYGLIIATVIAGPSLGACNALVFAMDKETLKQMSPARLKAAIESRTRSSAQVIHNYEVEDDKTSPVQYDSLSNTGSG